MRYFIVSLTLLFLSWNLGASALASENDFIVNDSLTMRSWNSFWQNFSKGRMGIRYNVQDNQYYLILSSHSKVAAYLDDETVDFLLKGIEKYKEWNRKASNKNVEIDKSIDVLGGSYIFKMFNDWYPSKPTNMRLRFFSQSGQKHDLIITFDNLRSEYNEYMEKDSSDVQYHLNWRQAIALEKALSEESFNRYNKAVVKRKAVSDSFQ